MGRSRRARPSPLPERLAHPGNPILNRLVFLVQTLADASRRRYLGEVRRETPSWFREWDEVNPVPSEVLDRLDEELARIDRPGSFCASGSVPAVLPGLEVTGLGPVGLPLTVKQAKELIKQCEQAPHGKGEKTLVNTKVRLVWKLDPGRFSLTNPAWNSLIETMVGKVQVELGLEKQKLESHLYDMLLYEPGSFFLAHRDGEKLDRMVATLVVVLPSDYEGGELVVRHDGQERTIDFQSGENSRL